MIICFIISLLLKILFIRSSCIEGENHCLKCNPLTKLCYKYDMDIFIPDEKGGCDNIKKCIFGENYCVECQEDESLCQKCIEGYYPDESGGCSYTDNCEISYKGNCLKYKNDYILIGAINNLNEGIAICKSKYFDDLKNCEKINLENGLCKECKEGYYLSNGDNKCTSIEKCFESSFNICKKCDKGFYLIKKENKCKEQIDIFDLCQQTLDGEIYEICDDGFFFDNNGFCVNINFCEKRKNFEKCEKCIEGFFLSKEENSCTNTENCKNGDKEIGICTECNDNYYHDYKDGKCKSNQEDNEFKYYKISENGIYKECINEYFLGEDFKCSNSPNCSESENGICLNCVDNYFLADNNKCTNVEHCIIPENNRCSKCEDNYYYSFIDNKCLVAEGKYENCKYSVNDCLICKDEYYLNLKDHICYSNNDDNDFYKCSLVDNNGERCIACIQGYNLNALNHRCTKL